MNFLFGNHEKKFEENIEEIQELFQIKEKDSLSKNEISFESLEKSKKKEDKKNKHKKDKHKKNKHQQEEKRERKESEIFTKKSLNDRSKFSESRKKETPELSKSNFESILKQESIISQIKDENCLSVIVSETKEQSLYETGIKKKDIKKYYLTFDVVIGIKESKQCIFRKMLRLIKEQLSMEVFNHYPSERMQEERYYSFSNYFEEAEHIKRITPNLQQENQKIKANENLVVVSSENYIKKLNKEPNNILLWLEFIEFEEKKELILEDRFVSILEKALFLNPKNEKLLCKYFDYQMNRKEEIELPLLECLRDHPCNLELWRMYLVTKLKYFHKSSHISITLLHEEIIFFFNNCFANCKSAKEIWNIKETLLLITRYILTVYRMEGFKELATVICRVSLEFNLCIEQNINIFTNEQSKYHCYRLGETNENEIFIGIYEEKLENINTIDSEIEIHLQKWRPSHANYDTEFIKFSPESFIFVEDWQFLLSSHKDQKGLALVIDNFADNLGLPYVFHESNSESSFFSNAVQKMLEEKLKGGQLIDFTQSPLWISYWPIQNTSKIIKSHEYSKIVYFFRILLCTVKIIDSALQSQIYEYLMFICSFVSNNTSMKEIFEKEFETRESFLSFMGGRLLKADEFNVKLWAIYISGYYLNEKDLKSCIKCFLDLFSCVSSVKKQIETLFYLHSFLIENKLFEYYDLCFVLLFKYLISSSKEPIHEEKIAFEKISPFDSLLIHQYLLERWKIEEERIFICYFLLELKIKTSVIEIDTLEIIKHIEKENNHIANWIAIKYKLVEQCRFEYSSVALLQYKAKRIVKPLAAISLKYTMPEWLGIFTYLIDHSIEKQKIFFVNGSRLCSVRFFKETEIFIFLMNKYSICEKKFLFYWLDNLPYSKMLYLLYLKKLVQENDFEEAEKLMNIMKTKQIRLYNKLLF